MLSCMNGRDSIVRGTRATARHVTRHLPAAACLAACVVSSVAALSADLDPATVTELTVAQARSLGAAGGEITLPKLATLPPAVAAALVTPDLKLLDLPGIITLEPAAAAALVTDGRLYTLRLDGLEELSPEMARILARHEYQLRLAGLRKIDSGVAAELVRGNFTNLALPLPADVPLDTLRALGAAPFNLNFTGPAVITAEFADAFIDYRKVLEFSGPVAPLDPDVARRLTFPGMLNVEGPIVLSDEVAAILEQRKGDVWIQGLTALTPGVARMLASRRESVDLQRLTTIDAECAGILAGHRGHFLWLPAVAELGPEAARALTRFEGWLSLTGLRDLTPEVAGILASHRSDLVLGLDALTPELAAALASHACELLLPSVEAVDGPDAAAIARTLAGKPGSLRLPRLRRVTPRALEALASGPQVEIPLVESLELVGGTAGDDLVLPEAFLERQRQKRAEGIRQR